MNLPSNFPDLICLIERPSFPKYTLFYLVTSDQM